MLFILLGLMAIFVVTGIVKTKKLINPLSLFNMIWLLVISIYQLRLSVLQDPIEDKTIITFMICILSFSIFFILGIIFKISNKNNKQETTHVIEYKTIRNLFFFWVFIEIIETIYSGGLPIFWKILDSTKNYMNYGIPTLHGFMNSISLVIVLLSTYLYLYNRKKTGKRDKRLIGILLTVLIFDICMITRQVIISAIIEMIAIYIVFNNKIPWKKLIIITLVIIIAFGILGNFRTGYEEFLNVAVMKQPNINKSLIGFYWVYMYLTMTVSNVNNAVLLDVNGFGLQPIASIYLPTIISDVLFADNIEIPQYLVTQAFNVSGFFMDFYIAFGNLGVGIISAIYGILGAYLYKKLHKNENEKNILYYAVYLQIILLSFFYNHLLYLPSGFQFIIIFLLFNYKSIKKELLKIVTYRRDKR